MKGLAKFHWRWTRISVAIALGMLLVVALAAASGSARVSSTQQAGYVGSKVCMGCHTGKYDKWVSSGHANMVVQIRTSADLPASLDGVAEDLKSELNKAAYIVAGQRFTARDPKTGELTYLNVVYDKASNTYQPTKGGSSWEKGCAGCHSTGIQKDHDISGVEMGIGCEACHGPGLEHIKGKGDVSKIIVSNEAVTCGRCHNGGKSDTGTAWPDGWKLGMTLEEVGFHLNPIDPNGIPGGHDRQMGPLVASGHMDAVKVLAANDHANANCYTCHSTTARSAAKHGEPITDLNTLKNLPDGVSCTACHSPHGPTQYPSQLNEDPKTLCISCHTSSLAEGTTLKVGGSAHHSQKELFLGYGAIGIDPVPSAHFANDVSCYNCHMTGGSHQFKVILPSAVKGTKTKDSCTSCHTGSSASIRGAYLEMWQKTVTESLADVQTRIAAAEAKIAANPDMKAELIDSVKTAKTNITLITADKSNGAHNFDYAMRILDDAANRLTDFETATK